jgi:predicted transcriptional regulator
MRMHFGSFDKFPLEDTCTLCGTERAIGHVDVDFSALFFALQSVANLPVGAR